MIDASQASPGSTTLFPHSLLVKGDVVSDVPPETEGGVVPEVGFVSDVSQVIEEKIEFHDGDVAEEVAVLDTDVDPHEVELVQLELVVFDCV